MKTSNFLKKQFKSSYETLKKNKHFLVLFFLFDILFFILVILSASYFYDQILEELIQIVDVIGRENIYNQLPEEISFLPGQAFYQSFNQITKLSFYLFFSVFAIYTITQGVNWFLSNYIVKKLKFKEYFQRFFIINLFWAFLIVMITYFSVKMAFINLTNLGALINQNFLNSIILLIFLVLSYPLLAKYDVRTTLKKTFLLGFEKSRELIFVYVFALVTLIIDILIIRFGINQNSYFIVILAIILLLFLLSYLIVLITKTVRELN